MPFGAEVLEAGGVRFRLWAPGAGDVDLCLGEHGGERLHMARGADGWHERVVPGAGAGTRYRYRVHDDLLVPDPASRFQPGGVHAASEVIDPRAFEWPDAGWRGRPWHETVLYELHVGAFSASGDFAGVEARLDHLAALGVTAVELMPLSAFPGARGWGYDGVAPFAPHAAYGGPRALKSLVAAAHARGLMVFLDVVYNHFGPEGCYLHAFAPEFFTDRHHTPWGAALAFDGPHSAAVRAFFVHNALYWLQEYRLDGLRLDAVHAIQDDSEPHLLEELAAAVAAGPGRERAVHLVVENDDNRAWLLEGCSGAGRSAGRETARGGPDGAGRETARGGPGGAGRETARGGPDGARRETARGEPDGAGAASRGRYRAQWNDDLHHCLHVLLTGEDDGYYVDYADAPLQRLGRCLAEGFAYQGGPSANRGGEPRGERSDHLPSTAFVGFLQNHDQVGNRAFGERITALAPTEAVRAANAVVALAPHVPMLFMGEEFDAAQPFPFFCDFGPDLARAVTEGRRREFERFERFADASARARIPDPNAARTFESARLDWRCLEGEGGEAHRDCVAYFAALFECRSLELVPRLAGTVGDGYTVSAAGVLEVRWRLGDGSRLVMIARLAAQPAPAPAAPAGKMLFLLPADLPARLAAGGMPAWSVGVYLQAREEVSP